MRKTRVKPLMLVASLLLFAPLAVAERALIEVTQSDSFTGTPDDGLCALAEALDIIQFVQSPDCAPTSGNPTLGYTLRLPSNATIVISEPYDADAYWGPTVMSLSRDLVIDGNGATLKRESDANFRFINLSGNSRVEIKNLTLLGGESIIGGGAIHIYGSDLKLTNVRFIQNSSSENGGAVTAISSNLEVNRSIFRENTAEASGALHVQGGTLIVESSSFLSNTSSQWGSAISLMDSGNLYRLENNTLHGNVSDGALDAGAIFASQNTTITLRYNTITENIPANLVAQSTDLSMIGNIIATDGQTSGQCVLEHAADVDFQYNLVQDGSCGDHSDSLIVARPELEPPSGEFGLRYPKLESETWQSLHQHTVIDQVPCHQRGTDTYQNTDRLGEDRRPFPMPYTRTPAACDLGAVEYWNSNIITVTNPEGLDVQQGDGCTLTEALMNANNQADFSDCASGQPGARDIVVFDEIKLDENSIQILETSEAFQIPVDEPLTVLGRVLWREECVNYFSPFPQPPCYWDRFPPLFTVHSVAPTIIQGWSPRDAGPGSVIAAPGSAVYLYDIGQRGESPRSTHPLLFANLANVRLAASVIDGGGSFYDNFYPNVVPYPLAVDPQFIDGNLIHAQNSLVELQSNRLDNGLFPGNSRRVSPELRESIYANNSLLYFHENTLCGNAVPKKHLINAPGKSQVVLQNNTFITHPYDQNVEVEPLSLTQDGQCDNAACLIIDENSEIIEDIDVWYAECFW